MGRPGKSGPPGPSGKRVRGNRTIRFMLQCSMYNAITNDLSKPVFKSRVEKFRPHELQTLKVQHLPRNNNHAPKFVASPKTVHENILV